jgi:hypothetical protein
MESKIPASLKAEHEELHAQLDSAVKCGGKTGEAAMAVAKLMHPHFLKEEEYALPPLGILQELASGNIKPEMRLVLPMTEKLKSKLPEMMEEHQQIVKVLQQLLAVAKEENQAEVVAFTEKLMLHAKTEEEVSYPAAILIGEYLKLKMV